ncbi:AAA family ATPase [Deinococcus sp. AB2017081]|uniref:AAA family ATPase n=1 Tax=Deinococcus sp. AB2017081 TaxID=3093660 RepID=UPI002ACC2B50|nr:AAA family ATPase [Deinococcus sp. AB2017081]WQE97127.1 AAA family ATPase [Deinococcus sp. AB2017081]
MFVSGSGKKTAELTFRAGVNYISGESNMGKSFILKCLDFMLGGKKRPEEIEEARGYTLVSLEFEARQGGPYTLEASFGCFADTRKTAASRQKPRC